MKLIARTMILGLFAVAGSAAVLSFNSTPAMAATSVSHQAVVTSMPVPDCSPSTSGGQCPKQSGW